MRIEGVRSVQSHARRFASTTARKSVTQVSFMNGSIGAAPHFVASTMSFFSDRPRRPDPHAQKLGPEHPFTDDRAVTSLDSWLPVVAVGAGAFALVQTARLGWLRALPAKRVAFARARGARGEALAERLLEAHGYTIVERQLAARYALDVDGGEETFLVRADFVVEKAGRRFVAEAKAGAFAPRLETAATRRQILEYSCAFDVDGVVLVDAESSRLKVVSAPIRAAPPRPVVSWVLAAFVLGTLAGAWLARG